MAPDFSTADTAMPSVEKMKDEDILQTARRMYLGGFLFLPWLWLVNYLYFRPILDRPTLNPLVKQCIEPIFLFLSLGRVQHAIVQTSTARSSAWSCLQSRSSSGSSYSRSNERHGGQREIRCPSPFHEATN